MKTTEKVWKVKQHIDRKRWLIGWLFTSAIIQFSFVAKSSIWHDEGYSLLLVRNNFTDIITKTARDVHPPLYYLVLKIWTFVFGSSVVSVRALSIFCILGLIFFAYLIVKRLFGYGVANATAMLMALAPFLIRYGQEARMYALVAFLVTVALYFLLTALDSRSKLRLYLFAIFSALSIYTHYYAIFMIPVYWAYVALRTKPSKQTPGTIHLFSLHWWLSNIVTITLFLPWIPFAFSQFTRVQGGFWIPPVDLSTLPSTISHFLLYSGLSRLDLSLKLLIVAIIFILSGIAFWMNKKQRNSIALLFLWAFFAPIITIIISLYSRPVYINRYFVFSAAGFYPLLSAILYLKPLNSIHKARPIILGAFIVMFLFGIRNVYLQSNHKMNEVANVVNTEFRSGDIIIAGELYVMLDFSYYNKTNTDILLYAPNGINGYGETSLFYDKEEKHTFKSFTSINPKSGKIWMIGKPGDKEYYNEIPSTWSLQSESVTKDSSVRLYNLQ